LKIKIIFRIKTISTKLTVRGAAGTGRRGLATPLQTHWNDYWYIEDLG